MVSSTSCLRLKASTHSERGRPSSDPKDSRVRLSGPSGRLISRLNVLSRPGTIPRSAPPAGWEGNRSYERVQKVQSESKLGRPRRAPTQLLDPIRSRPDHLNTSLPTGRPFAGNAIPSGPHLLANRSGRAWASNFRK